MPDREKVIECLKACAVDRYKAEYCLACPYDFCGHDEDTGVCVDRLMADALALLKEQEPVKPDEMVDDFYLIGDPLRTIGWKCGQCGERIAYHDKYCPACGRSVKWDD